MIESVLFPEFEHEKSQEVVEVGKVKRDRQKRAAARRRGICAWLHHAIARADRRKD